MLTDNELRVGRGRLLLAGETPLDLAGFEKRVPLVDSSCVAEFVGVAEGYALGFSRDGTLIRCTAPRGADWLPALYVQSVGGRAAS
jgi:hypothetical protein